MSTSKPAAKPVQPAPDKAPPATPAPPPARPETHVFTPSEPIVVQDKTYTTLTFRRRRAKDMAAMDLVKGKLRKSFAMYASMADVPLPVIEAMDGDDFDRMVVEIMPLMGKSMEKAFEEEMAKQMKEAVEEDSD